MKNDEYDISEEEIVARIEIINRHGFRDDGVEAKVMKGWNPWAPKNIYRGLSEMVRVKAERCIWRINTFIYMQTVVRLRKIKKFFGIYEPRIRSTYE